MSIYDTFNSEQNSIIEQLSINSNKFLFYEKDEDIFSSFFPEYAKIKNEVNFDSNFSNNIIKYIDNSISQPSNQNNKLNKELGKDNLIDIENLITIEKDKKSYFTLSTPNKHRGRLAKRKRSNISPHDKYKNDNLTRKIRAHSINFILLFVNFILKIVKLEKFKFRNISYEFKKNVKKDAILSLKKMTIREILCQKLSPKIKIEIKKDNSFIFESIKDNPIIKKLLDKKYLEIFKEIYCKKEKKINLKDYGSDEDRIIIFPETIKIFKDLLKKNINNYRYMKKLEECVNNNFLMEPENKIIEEN